MFTPILQNVLVLRLHLLQWHGTSATIVESGTFSYKYIEKLAPPLNHFYVTDAVQSMDDRE